MMNQISTKAAPLKASESHPMCSLLT